MNPIDTYTQKRFGSQATFQLFPDKLVIRGSAFLQYRFESKILLSTVDPNFGRVWGRDQQCWMGVFLVVLFTIIAAISYAVSANEKTLHTEFWAWGRTFFFFTLPPILFGIWMTYRTIRQVETAVFLTSAGAAAFSVSCIGDYKIYESFITSIVEAIKSDHDGNSR